MSTGLLTDKVQLMLSCASEPSASSIDVETILWGADGGDAFAFVVFVGADV